MTPHPTYRDRAARRRRVQQLRAAAALGAAFSHPIDADGRMNVGSSARHR